MRLFSILVILVWFVPHHMNGQNIPRPMIAGPYGLSVNSYTGSLLYQRTDMEVRGRGMPLQIGFAYSTANDTLNRGYGKGWTFMYHYAYKVQGDSLFLLHPDGKQDLYRGPVNGIYQAPTGVFDSLLQGSGGALILRKKNGMRYFFENATHKRLTKITDLNGNTTTLTYAGDYPVQITNASGRSVSLIWNNGFLQNVSDASYSPARTVQLAYDNKKRLISVTNPLGQVTTFAYEGDGQMLNGMSDPKGNPVKIVYRSDFRVKEINTCVNSLTFNFQPDFGRSFFIRQSGGKNLISTYLFDTLGRFMAFENPLGLRRTYQYDAQNNLIEETDFKGNTTHYTYDAFGNVLTATDALNKKITYTYSATCTCGKPASFTDKRGNTVTFAYNGQGNLTGLTNTAGTTTFTYNSFGEVTGITDARNKNTTFTYDAQGNLTQVAYPIGNTLLQYDAAGNLTQVTDPNNLQNTLTYDRLGRVIAAIDAKGYRTQFEYDPSGNLSKITNPRGRQRIFAHDPLHRLIGVQYGVEQMAYIYDEEGNLTELTNPRGQKTTFQYDANNRLLEERDPLGNKTAYTYDDNGNLLQKTNPDGSIIAFQYDALNRLLSRTYGGETDTYGYDDNGNLTSAVNGVVTYSMEYDALSRLTKVMNVSWGKTIQYQYDAIGNRTRMSDPNGGQHHYAYDDNNRLVSLTDPLNQIYTFLHDAGGRMTRKNNPNNTYTTYQYDNAGNLTDLTNYGTGNTVHSFSRYTLDSLGFRSTLEDPTGTHRYFYDPNDRLQRVIYSNGDTVTYTFDAFGNVTQRQKNNISEAFTYNNYDQIVSGAGAQYQFDPGGNLKMRSGGTQPTLSYQFDALHRFRGGQFTTGKRVEYQYDPFGNLIQRRDTANALERYLFDGQNLLANLDGNNAVQTIFTHDLSLDGWLGKIGSGNQSRYFLRDGLGSVTGVIDGSGQNVNTYRYGVYGDILATTGSEANRVLFSGRLWDGQMGMYDYRSRFVDPNLGRFISEDRFVGFAEFPISINKYLAVNGNPINYIDPTGNVIPVIVGAAIGAVLGGVLSAGGEALSQAVAGCGFNGRNIAKAAAIGLVAGAVAGALSPVSGAAGFATVGAIGRSMAVGAGTSVGADAATQLANDGNINAGKLGVSAVAGAFGGLFPTTASQAIIGGPLTAAAELAKIPASGGKQPCPPPKEPEKPNEPNNPNDPNNPNGSNNPSGPQGSPGPGGNNNPSGQSGQVDMPTSVDPNEIRAPKGYGPQRWVAGKDRLPFTILFENDPDLGATAPAKKVVVRHPLPNKINSSSFRIGDFGFGSFAFKVPENRAAYTTRLDLKDSIGLFVDVTAGLDIQNNEAFWIFQSIDPATGLESTLDPLQGFLPVNDSLVGNGEGFVTFSVVPKTTAQTLDTVIAKATIFFDDEDPVNTNVERNLIDAGKPTSKLTVLPFSQSDSILLNMTGKDDTNGVGVGTFSVFVSKNNAPFVLHQKDIATSPFVFKGEAGASYAFYSLAKDHVGNEENPKTIADGSTKAFAEIVKADGKVFLQGPYVSSVLLMQDSLRRKNLIPLMEPYTGLTGFTHVIGGGEKTRDSVLMTTGPNAIVDWVFLELRNAANPLQVLFTRAALLQRDGDIVDVDGVSPVTFGIPHDQSYYLTVRHRNHLGVQLGATKLYPKGTTVTTDFRTLPPEGFYNYNNANAAQRLISGKYVMWAGNGRIDYQLKYNGGNNDRNTILSVVGLATPNQIVNGYHPADYNMDGQVKYNGTSNDRNVLLGNVGLTTPNNILHDQIAH